MFKKSDPMKKTFLLSLFTILLCSLLAQTQEPPAFWENEFINEYNREPMHVTYFAFENKELAIQ